MPDSDAKQRILKAAISLMDETKDSDKITIREIAGRAGVGVGLINYHFQTRENLLYEAIGEYMLEVICAMRESSKSESPVENLKAMLKAMGDIGERHEKQMRIGAQYELMQGELSAANYLLPLLREIYMDKKDETALRVMALDIIATTNLGLLRYDVFFKFTGLNMKDKKQRDRFIDIIVENYIKD